MEYKLTELKNRLHVMTIPMPSLESATVSVWVKTGSRNEEKGVLGLSHFLEHMAFKGGKKYSSAKKVSEAIDSIGGEFNAGTSKEITKYYVRLRSGHLETAFDVLSDMILKPNLKEKDVEREKGVIIEEMRMYEDTPVRRVWDYFEQLIFKGHCLGEDIIGNERTVRDLKDKDFIDYRNKYYYSANMLITVSGGVGGREALNLSEKYFDKIQQSGSETYGGTFKDYNKPQVKLVSKKNEQGHFVLGYPANPLGSEDRYKDAVLNSVLGGGMSSRLFTEVREKRGLAYAVKSDFERFIDTGYFAVYAGVDPGKIEEALKVILDELDKISKSKKKISKKEFEKGKEYLKGHIALSLEDTREVGDFFGYEQLMLNKVRTPEEVFESIDKVTIDDLYQSAKKTFDPKKANLAIIGPYKNQKKFEKLLR